MKLLFKQRLFSWLDSYDIFDETGNTAYSVKGKISWGHKLVIYDKAGNEVGMVAEKIFTLLPKFEIYKDGYYAGQLKKELSFFIPHYSLDYSGWRAEGSLFEWDYSIVDVSGNAVASVSKELFNLTDTYVLDIKYPEDALDVLMFVLAIDAEKCSRHNN